MRGDRRKFMYKLESTFSGKCPQVWPLKRVKILILPDPISHLVMLCSQKHSQEKQNHNFYLKISHFLTF